MANRFRARRTAGILAILIPFFLVSCASGPKPEGQDFLSETSSKKMPERGSAFVSPRARDTVYKKVAVMPFKAPIELAGASIADMFGTELMKTYKYELVERSQMEQVLGEQALGLKGVTESSLAIRVGEILGVQGVIVGTVPEYGMRAVGSQELPAVGINIRMINVQTGSVVWSVTDSAIAKKPVSISAFARHLIESMVFRLVQEWKRAKDTFAIFLPTASVASYRGKIRGVEIEVMPDSPDTFRGYRLLRSSTADGRYTEIMSVENRKSRETIVMEDKGLLDAETYYYKVAAVSVTGLNGPLAGPYSVTTTGPPSPVANLRAQGNQPRKIPLSWATVNEPEVKGYKIFRADQRGGPFKEIKFIKGKDKGKYLDKGKGGGFFSSAGGLDDFTEYFYKIQVVNVVDVTSPYSPIVSTITKPVPVAVAGMRTSQLSVKEVSLGWTPNPERDIAKYEIFRGSSPDSVTRKIKTVSGAIVRYLDDGLKDGRTYFYKIRAIDKDKLKGKFSNIVASTTKPLPAKPAGLSAEYNGGRIELNWRENPENDISKYEVFLKGFLWKKLGETQEHSFYYQGKFKQGETIVFRVRAVDATRLVSQPSDNISVTAP